MEIVIHHGISNKYNNYESINWITLFKIKKLNELKPSKITQIYQICSYINTLVPRSNVYILIFNEQQCLILGTWNTAFFSNFVSVSQPQVSCIVHHKMFNIL